MLEPGSNLVVGSHTVTVVRFLSEGGFSRIYEVQAQPRDAENEEGAENVPPKAHIACLKQVKVADKAGLTELRKEVDVMRTLRDARNIVKYYDLNAERMPDGTYQVLVLMELCPNKSLLEYMNAHIREKLTEKQILAIMMDIAIGVYEMHRIQLVHRDIKIENVLIDAKNRFKLCDFGSVSTAIRPPKDQQEFQMLSHDIMYHTTPQYRAPEMLDLTRGITIDDKADIWAIGCFLYKLCYYTTPFEAAGDIAIVHASFQFPPDPPAPLYSGDLKNLIIIMLQQDPRFRPNIVQIIILLAKMCNKDYDELQIDDFTKAGPYDFHALHEMQREKQKFLIKQQQQQQQYYYEQQQQQVQSAQQQALKEQLARSAASLRANLLDSAHADAASAAPVAPVAVGNVVASSPNNMIPSEVRRGPKHSVPTFNKPTHLLRSNGFATPSRPSSAVEQHVDVPSQASPLTSEHSNPSVIHSPNSNTHPELEPSDDLDLLDLGNLDDIENRYPALDALDHAVASPSAKVPKLPYAASNENPPVNTTNHQKKPSELENVEAWEKSHSNTIHREAEKLVSDIFQQGNSTQPKQREGSASEKHEDVSRHNSQASTKSHTRSSYSANPEPVKSAVSELQPPIDIPSGKVAAPHDFYQATDMNPSISTHSVSTKINPQTILPYQQPISQKTPNQIPVKASSTSNHAQVPDFIQKQSPGPVSSMQTVRPISNSQQGQDYQHLDPQNYQTMASSKQAKSPYQGSSKPATSSSNPWGDALERTPKAEARAPAVHNNLIPDYGLSKQILNLTLEENTPISKMPSRHKPIETNLIELEVGLSSSSSVNVSRALSSNNKSNKDLSYLDDMSLIDMDSDEMIPRGRASEELTRPSFKKGYPGLREPNVNFQEEVIDFASDDENNNSEMSRVAIRQSLKKTRKASDHRRSDSGMKRSESSHRRSDSANGGETRKRLSFFGQGN